MGARARPVPGAGHRYRFSERPGSLEWRQGRIRQRRSDPASAPNGPAASRQRERFARQRLPGLSRIFGSSGTQTTGDRLVSAVFDLADLQGNILRGYRKPHVRYLILEVADRIAARRWLAASISGRDHGVPQITTGNWGAARPDTCFNIGLTYEGLRALATPGSSLAMFPNEFIEGMTARALKLGDVGPSAPETWPKPFNEPERIHLIATIYADKLEQLDQVQQRALDRNALTLLGTRDGHN